MLIRASSQSGDYWLSMCSARWCTLMWVGPNKPVGGEASVRREWMSSTASVSSIYGNDCKWLCLFMEILAYKRTYFHRYTPPARRHPSCHGRGPVLTLRLSFPSGSGTVWIVASAQESESPQAPLSAPASKSGYEAWADGMSKYTQEHHQMWDAAPIRNSHLSRLYG